MFKIGQIFYLKVGKLIVTEIEQCKACQSGYLQLRQLVVANLE